MEGATHIHLSAQVLGITVLLYCHLPPEKKLHNQKQVKVLDLSGEHHVTIERTD